jgi:homoserine O-acetyltransferase
MLHEARLAYTTHGTINADRSNVVVFPTAYGGTHLDNEWMIAAGMALDPARWFVVCPNMFGNGLSSSPSNAEPDQRGSRFPNVTVYDNVFAQRALLDHLGVDRVALAVGFSMGAQQAFHWGAAFPDRVDRIAAICGSAKTAEHNIVFLDGIAAALTADAAFADGSYTAPPVRGLEAVGRVWAAWGLSQTWYREEQWRDRGFASREDFVREWYVGGFGGSDANDLLAMLWTWKHADVGAHEAYANDVGRALAAIRAKTLALPCLTDLYFPPEDNALEVAQMPNAKLRTIPSIWGHAAGGNSNPADSAFVNAAVAELLAT